MKKTYLLLIFALSLLTACSDVDIDNAAYSEAVTNLQAQVEEGSRKVTLTWDNPTMEGQTGVRIIKDDNDVTDIEGVVNSYVIKKAPTNVPVSYTVKAVYSDGRVSLGQTVRLNIAYEAKKGNLLAMLVANDYTASKDETAAVEWFKKEYVNKGAGVLVTPQTIDELDAEKQAACWVMCDRCGIAAGWENLPGSLASNETVNALKAFTTDGGNLFLSNHATQLTVAVGRIPEAYKPGIFGSGDGGQNNDIWGAQPLIGNVEGQIYDHTGHDIYHGMTIKAGISDWNPIYTFESAGIKGDHNCMWDLNAYSLVPNPNVVKTWEETTNSTVLGTWNHVKDYCCAGIVDFNPTSTFAGRILAVGLASYEWDIETVNTYQDQLEKFTSNCITYLK